MLPVMMMSCRSSSFGSLPLLNGYNIAALGVDSTRRRAAGYPDVEVTQHAVLLDDGPSWYCSISQVTAFSSYLDHLNGELLVTLAERFKPC